MAKKPEKNRPNRGVPVLPRRRPGALTIASALVAAMFTGVFLWLMLGGPDEPAQVASESAEPAESAAKAGTAPNGAEMAATQPHDTNTAEPAAPEAPAEPVNTTAQPAHDPAEKPSARQAPAEGVSPKIDTATTPPAAPTGEPATIPPPPPAELPAAKHLTPADTLASASPPRSDPAASATPTGVAPVASATPSKAPSQPPAISKPQPPQTGKPSDRLALAPVPDPALTQRTTKGLLPVIAPDGRQPWQTYARPFSGDADKPRIAILIVDLGLSQAATKTAIQQLPGTVSLAYSPYARGTQNWIAESRAAGHEVMLQLPMEPYEFPSNDPGPHALLTSLSDDQNLERLEWLLGRFTGYVGVTNNHGDKFTASAKHLRPVIKALQERGLMFLDLRASDRSVAAQVAKELNVPRAINNRFIDSPEASRLAIDARLNELERIARQTGTAVGIGYPRPVTLERIANWAPTLALKGIVLSPITSVVNRQELQ